MSTHANLSPSKRNRWGVCPGSIREEAKYPEAPSGPAAADGTHTHSVLEYCLKSNLIGSMHLVGTKFTDKEGEFIVDADRAKRVDVALSYIRGQIQGKPYELLSEERVDPEFLLGRMDLSGTVDCQLWVEDVYEIIDYKDGMGQVDAKDNPQLEQYAIGVLSRFKLTPFEPYPFSTVRMTIIQPKLALKGMPVIVSHDVSVVDLLAKIPTIKGQADATDDPNAPLVPGETQCKFCRAKGACSALAGNVMKEVGLMFQPIIGDGNTTQSPEFLTQEANEYPLDVAQQSADKDPATMDNDQIRQILEAAPLVRQFIEGVETEARRRLEAGISVPGFKLIRGRGSRGWSLPEDQMAEKLIKMGIPKGSVYESKLVSPSKAESIVWEKRDGSKVQLSQKQIEKLNSEYVTSSSGKLTVVPESDIREAVVTNAASMFSPVATATVEVAPAPVEALPAWLS